MPRILQLFKLSVHNIVYTYIVLFYVYNNT